MLRLANLDPDPEDDAVTVAVAARRLGCAQSTVRALLACGELTGHRVGKSTKPGGIRVHAISIREYRQRHAIGAKPVPADRDRVGRDSQVSHNPGAREARRELRKLGML
jgi:excisionase family DNA binding protein